MTVPALVQLKVTSAVCSFFAIAITVHRLYIRRDRYWWDDACAFLSMIFLFLQVIAVFMHLPNPHTLTHMENVAAYYIMAASFYAIIWTARLAILYSVIRIDPNPITRKHLHYVGVAFIFVQVFMISQLFWVCEPMPSWKKAASPQCPLDKQVAICQLVTDIISDILLIIAPLRLIRHMSAVDGTRRRLMMIFSTSIITTIVSLVHAALILDDGGIKVVIAALVEDTFSLMVCNLPVVVTAGMRKLGKSSEEETNETGQSSFGWRVASRYNSMATTDTTNSDTAMDVTTINLRDFSTSTTGGVGTRTIDLSGAVVAAQASLPATEKGGHEQDASKPEDADAANTKSKQTKKSSSIMWVTPDKLDRAGSESRREYAGDADADADEEDAK